MQTTAQITEVGRGSPSMSPNMSAMEPTRVLLAHSRIVTDAEERYSSMDPQKAIISANNPDFLNFCLLIHQAAMNMTAARNASTVPPSGAGAGAVRPGRGGYSWVFWVR